MILHFLPSGKADAIIIHFQDKEGKHRNLCIDSGFPKTYKAVLKKALTSIAERDEKVDLWVITHIHDDHIGGILAYLKDTDFPSDFVTEFWFNPSLAIIPEESGKISVKQGILLREYLIEAGKCQAKTFCNDLSPIDFFGSTITILSPDQNRLDAALVAWEREEKASKSAKPIAGYFDYNKSIEELKAMPFQEDTSVWNGSSIAFLIENQGKRALFLGDSHPSIVAANLRARFGCSKDNPLAVDLVKVSHHGSAGNTSPELLKLIDCNHFAFCADGKGSPTKATLIRIATSRLGKTEPTTFLFNHPPTIDIFRHEPEAANKLNFRIEHLPNGYFVL